MPAIKKYDISAAIIADNALFILRSILHSKIFHIGLAISYFHRINLSLDVAEKPTGNNSCCNG
jgi:hypothetical protein